MVCGCHHVTVTITGPVSGLDYRDDGVGSDGEGQKE